MIEKIVQTAKQTVNAIVESQRAADRPAGAGAAGTGECIVRLDCFRGAQLSGTSCFLLDENQK
jgi:hypothetical protein